MAEDGSSAPVFEFFDAAPAGPRRDLLGLWTSVPLPGAPEDDGGAAEDALAFDAPGGASGPSRQVAGQPAEPDGVEPVWRATYPEDRHLAALRLREAQLSLKASGAALDDAPARLDAYAARGPAAVTYSFSTLGTGLRRPEMELSLLLARTQESGQLMSYGVVDQVTGKWKDALEVIQSFASRLQEMVAQFAWVETRVAEEPVGQTRVAWDGDLDTVLAGGIGARRIRLHQRTLDLALESRRTTLRMSTLVIVGAAKLVAMAAAPGGIAVAMPSVLRFVELLRIEFEDREKQKGEPLWLTSTRKP
jgi:hypothetical protein